ncbi:MAG: non-heme chloroperoxidase [Actinomycetota bacterium]|jgi:pimeloyl-ACP methyl ester carboxylesterase|nr:non-heme chloroperoxidase [Actinomycetota bacterium]
MNTEVSANGVRLGLRVEGMANSRPIVFVHGWAQSSSAWAPQFADPALTERFRLVAMDLRGHGASDVPAEGYDEPRNWADELSAVLDFAGEGAIVVGWSYGGLVIADYLRTHGSARLSGIVLVGAITEIGRGRPGGKIGSAMRAALPAALSDDPQVAVPALVEFTGDMATKAVPGGFAQALLGTSLAVPPSVRGALFRRDIGSGDVLEAVGVPALVIHGTADLVVDPSAGQYAAGKIPGATMRWFEGVGHLPFVEAAPEFTTALRQFADGVTA